MRSLVVSTVAAALFLTAVPAFGYPAGSEALEARLLLKMGPDARAWITGEAARESSLHRFSDGMAVNAARNYGATGADVDALTFLILMQVERGADSDVHNVAANDMSANASRQDTRQAQMQHDGTVNSQAEQMSSGQQSAMKAQDTPIFSLLPPDKDAPKPAADVPLQTGDGQGVNLQDAMDRESRIEDMLDDVMKRLTPAQESLVQSMK
jgi:hypothetical protein